MVIPLNRRQELYPSSFFQRFGANEVTWKTGGLSPGVYLARLSAGGRSEVVRFVRVR